MLGPLSMLKMLKRKQIIDVKESNLAIQKLYSAKSILGFKMNITLDTSISKVMAFVATVAYVCYAIEEEIGSKEIKWSKLYDFIQQKAIVSAPSSCWFFAPGCAQLAADAFRRPIAVYPENMFVSSSPAL
ncbi:hypothetical protein BCV71DRAFT_232351 [Rhizopus microsporus]|uniref:Uncharacterized protein n=1 Tax=Rhizopus microsporus TaxID=58291 RepID=A0A1X0SAM6_RHIZD|nr:hypothetical protein BCV71DRAFT_232351 [Rhizopus microsporus]